MLIFVCVSIECCHFSLGFEVEARIFEELFEIPSRNSGSSLANLDTGV